VGSEERAVSAAARWLILGLGAATFLVAAKTHGRQLRLERELTGYWHVTFGAQNPAFVEALWRRERFLYWSVAAILAACTIAFRLLAPRFEWPLPLVATSGGRSILVALLLHVVAPLTAAFVVTGLLSVVRFVLAARAGSEATAARPDDWMSGALWGTAGWWALTLVMCAGLWVLAWRRAA
jgi:hypothetical protein